MLSLLVFDFIIYFNLFLMKLSRFDDTGYEFSWLN